MPITGIGSAAEVDPVASLVTALEAATVALEAAALTLADRGSWLTSTAYAVGDVATQAGQRYCCRTAHTSGTFATDLAASKWVSLDAVAALAASSNLSDVTNAATARTNLGLGTAALISSTAGGDLSGTLPSPTVAKVNGVAVTGTPSTGYVPTATSSTTATWQAQSGGGAVSSVVGQTGAVTAGQISSALTLGTSATKPVYPGLTNFSRTVPMCRSQLSGAPNGSNAIQSNGTDTGGMYRLRHDLSGYLASDIRLVYQNAYGMSNVPGNSITVKAAADVQAGSQTIAVTFNGASSVTIPPGGMAVSDPIYVPGPVLSGMFGVSTTPPYVRPALSSNPYSYINSRTYVTVTSGQRWPLNHQCGYTGDGAESGTSQTDKTVTGTVTSASAGTYAYGPSMVLTSSRLDLPIVLGVGDSIISGYNDASSNQQGFFDRAMRANRGSMHSLRYSQGGSGPGYLNASASAGANPTGSVSTGLLALPGVTHCVYMAGVNFLFNAGGSTISAGTKLTDQQLLWNDWVMLADLGIRVYACTITPFTSSTDSWATTGNQTASVNESLRTTINDWIRTTPSPLTGYIETADVCETSRNSGIWKVGYTGDGLHPNSTGHAALAALVPTGSFVA